MQIKVNFQCRDSILAAPMALDLVLFLDLAQRCPDLAKMGIQEWLSSTSRARKRPPAYTPSTTSSSRS